MIALNEEGLPDFRVLQERMHVRSASAVARLVKRVPATFMVFDLLRLDGTDLTSEPLERRRELLVDLMEGAPGRCPRRTTTGREPLADDPLQSLLPGRLVEHRPVVVRRGHLPGRALHQVHEQLAAALERLGREVGAVEAEQVEDHERRRHPLHQPGHGGRRTHVHPLLEHPEVGQTFLVQGDHLAVDEQVAPGQRGGRQIGPGGRDIVAVPAKKSV